MLLHRIIFKISSWLENALFLQAVCTLVSVPILWLWKMPNSYCSPLGNLLFAPFMSSFILLSALIFCCSLCQCYPKLLFAAFAKLVQLWLWCLRQGSAKWLFIPNGVTLACWLLGCCVLCWLWHSSAVATTLRRSMIVWLALFCLASAWQCYTQPLLPGQARYLYKGNQKLLVKQTDEGLSLVDFGIFGRLDTPEKFIIYQLKAFLLEHFYTPFIHQITLPQPSKRYTVAAQKCVELLGCQQVRWHKLAKPGKKSKIRTKKV